MNTLELKDKVAVVTGATAFIGRACAIRRKRPVTTY